MNFSKMSSKPRNIDLNLRTEILTAGTIAEIVNEILELLLFQRNQIPLIYKTFKYYVGKWSEAPAHAGQFSLKQFKLEHQRQLATKTKDAISEMREFIRKIFQNNRVKSIRFLFGATTFTPKEAYTLHIPTESISSKHFHEHHPIPSEDINQTLISLVTCDELFSIFSSAMPATNVYLELELLDDPRTSHFKINAPDNIKVFPKEISKIPFSCKNIHFNLLHSRPFPLNESDTKCCKELEIFEDIITSVSQQNLNDEENENMNADATTSSNELSNDHLDNYCAWWEAKVIVRGFKEEKTKAFNIWSS